VDVVHADSGGDVLEDEMVVKWAVKRQVGRWFGERRNAVETAETL
jgi:hypothetical protein